MIENEKSPTKDDFELKISYLAEHKIIKVVVSGGLNYYTYQQLVAKVIAASQQYATHLILVDHRMTSVEMGVLDVYDLPTLNLQLGLPSDLRVAIIYAMNEKNNRRFALYEDRAVTSDMKHYIFSDEPSAMEWLMNGA